MVHKRYRYDFNVDVHLKFDFVPNYECNNNNNFKEVTTYSRV